MQSNTISVSPLPVGTTQEKIREIFHAFSVKNVHIDFPTAFVEFRDQGDLENLDIQFDNYQVTELNNAKIDKAQFNWNSVNKENTSPDKKSDSNSSDKHQDLMAADLDHLVIVENCDQLSLKNLSEENIRQLFKNFQSINRILKRRKDIIIQLTDRGQMEQLQSRFPGFNISELGWNSAIEKADSSKITASEFVQEWSKLHTKESIITQATTHFGYGDEKPSSGELPRQKKFQEGSYESKPSSQQFLNQGIIPPFDKKTSMEVNFLNEQSKLGYKQQKPQHEPIHEAGSNQELDYTTQIKIQNDVQEDRFTLGYEAAERQSKAEMQKKKQQEERIQNERKEQQEKKRKQEEEKERIRKQQEQKQNERKIKQEQQRERQRNQQQQRLRKLEEEKERQEQEERQDKQRKEQAEIRERERKEEQQRQVRQRKEQEERQQRIKEQNDLRRKQEEEAKVREQQQARRLKQQRQQEQGRKQQLGYHQAPTQSENVAKQAEFIMQAGKTIEQQLGYAVNKAKQESADLINTGLQILRGHQTKPKEKIGYNSSTAQESFDIKKEKANLGYEKSDIKKQNIQELSPNKKQSQQVGLDLLNSSMEFFKGSYTKIQQTIGTIAKEVSNPSELGYEKWTVKPDVQVPKPVVGQQPRVLKTLITITLLIWVIFLLMQDTSQIAEIVSHENESGSPTVEATQEDIPVSNNQKV